MHLGLRIQEWLLHASPGLLPIVGLVFSALSSPHCAVMCTPFLPPTKDRHRFFVYRVIGYTTIGALLGGFGQTLRDGVEFRALAAIAFVLFAVLTLVVAGVRLLPFAIAREHLRRATGRLGPLRGLLFAFVPCHTLNLAYALAILTGSIWGGAILLFGHAVLTMPALAFGARWMGIYAGRWQPVARVAKFLVLLLCALNLFYFGSRIFLSEAESTSRWLFCL